MPDQTKDPIKEAFSKVKEDISSLKSQLEELSYQISALKYSLDTQTVRQSGSQAHNQTNQTDNKAQNQADQADSFINSEKHPLYSLKTSFSDISTGNDGVKAVRQSGSQAVSQTDNNYDEFAQYKPSQGTRIPREFTRNFQNSHAFPVSNPSQISQDKIGQIAHVSQVVSSLDSLKKDLRKQFKRLTPQEMLVFSSIYQLSDEGISVDYSLLSSKVALSESAVRDYVHKLIKKGIPLNKFKENNKRIVLSIPPELKRIASLQTILSLREL